jgi:UDP-N-acetylglucosamine acyltransferase
MVGMGTVVLKEVAAFSKVVGNPARVIGMNSVGLSRRGCSPETVEEFGRHLAGETDLPAGLPDEVANELTAWLKAQASQ